jgi:hypothetical protein
MRPGPDSAHHPNIMTISIEYKPGVGIIYGEMLIPWGSPRNKIREILQAEYESADREFSGINLRRDIYHDLQNQPVLVFFNYEKNDQFSSLEIHTGIALNVLDKTISIDMPFWEAVELAGKVSSAQKIIDAGEIIFIDLKLCLCDGAGMGGEEDDNQLSYIFCARDIDHLLN